MRGLRVVYHPSCVQDLSRVVPMRPDILSYQARLPKEQAVTGRIEGLKVYQERERERAVLWARKTSITQQAVGHHGERPCGSKDTNLVATLTCRRSAVVVLHLATLVLRLQTCLLVELRRAACSAIMLPDGALCDSNGSKYRVKVAPGPETMRLRAA